MAPRPFQSKNSSLPTGSILLSRARGARHPEARGCGEESCSPCSGRAAPGGVERFAAIRDLDRTVEARTWNASGQPGLDTVRRIRCLPARSFAAPLSGAVTTGYRRVRPRMDYLEWQTLDGIRWPHKTVNFHDGVKRAGIATTGLKFNSGMTREQLSQKPPA